MRCMLCMYISRVSDLGVCVGLLSFAPALVLRAYRLQSVAADINSNIMSIIFQVRIENTYARNLNNNANICNDPIFHVTPTSVFLPSCLLLLPLQLPVLLVISNFFLLFASKYTANEPHGSYVVMNFVRFNISAQQLFSSVFYHRLCVAAAHVLGRQLMCILWNVAVAASSKQMILDVCRHSTLHLFVVQLLVCIRDMLIHNLPI